MEFELKQTVEDLEKGRLLFARGTNFFKGVVSLSELPPDDICEVAFAGRSNVGKSSLINALTNINKLARTSNTPGRTRELNYFSVNGKMNLVDMPGYGYARASKVDIKKWNILVKQYLQGRVNLRCVFILIDSRCGLKDSDVELMEMLDESAVTYTIVLTKIDKLKKQELDRVYQDMLKFLKTRTAAFPFLIKVSSEKKEGIDIIRSCIFNFIKH